MTSWDSLHNLAVAFGRLGHYIQLRGVTAAQGATAMNTSNVYPSVRERFMAALIESCKRNERSPIEHIGGSWSPAQHARGAK